MDVTGDAKASWHWQVGESWGKAGGNWGKLGKLGMGVKQRNTKLKGVILKE